MLTVHQQCQQCINSLSCIGYLGDALSILQNSSTGREPLTTGVFLEEEKEGEWHEDDADDDIAAVDLIQTP